MYMEEGKVVVGDEVVIGFMEGDGVGGEMSGVCEKIVNRGVEVG